MTQQLSRENEDNVVQGWKKKKKTAKHSSQEK